MEFDDFRKQVKDALEHLYDAAYLEIHPLLAHLSDASSATRTTRAQKLRALLKDSIEQFHPHQDLPSGSPEWRSYLALRYRYVQGMNQNEIEHELGISLRQLQRELHKGLDALATLLWEQRQTIAKSDEPNPAQELENELSQWSLARQNCNVRELLEETLATLKPKIDARHIEVLVNLPSPMPTIFADATLTRQALLNVLRLAVNHVHEKIIVSGGYQDYLISIVIVAEDQGIDQQTEEWRNAELLFKAQGISFYLNRLAQIVMQFPYAPPARILVIDDNAAIQQLFERYLAPHLYQVIHAQDGNEAIRLAAEIQPNAITLDVMMPHMDGWQVLRALQENSATRKIPVIVCSVLKEPELALSLGARAYLKKPVERLTLVETLEKLLRE